MAGLLPFPWNTFATKEDLRRESRLIRAELRREFNKVLWGLVVVLITTVFSQPIVEHYFGS